MLKTFENLFKLHAVVVDDIHPSKRTILKNYSVSYSEIENNELQSWNVSASNGIVMHFQWRRFFVASINKSRTWKLFKKRSTLVSLLLHTYILGHVFSSCMVNILYEMCPNTELFLVRNFPHSDWIRRDTKYISVFSPNAGKYGSEKLRIWKLFKQWDIHANAKIHWRFR